MEAGPAGRAWAGPRPKSSSRPALPTSTPPAARPFVPRRGPLVRLLERGCWAFPNICSSQCVDPLPRLAVQGPQVEKHRHIAVEATPWQCPRPTAIAFLQTTGRRVPLTCHQEQTEGQRFLDGTAPSPLPMSFLTIDTHGLWGSGFSVAASFLECGSRWAEVIPVRFTASGVPVATSGAG